MQASATEQTKETTSDHNTVTISVTTGRTPPHAYGMTPRLAVGSDRSRAPLGARQLLLLLLQVLRDGAGTLDGELLDLTVRGAGERVQELRDLVELTLLEQRLEVVVRQTHVRGHLGLVLRQESDDGVEVALLSVQRRELDQRERVVLVAAVGLIGKLERLVSRRFFGGVEPLKGDVRRGGFLVRLRVRQRLHCLDCRFLVLRTTYERVEGGPRVDTAWSGRDRLLDGGTLVGIVTLALEHLGKVQERQRIVRQQVLRTA